MMNSIWDKPVSHGEILKKAWKHLDLGVLDRDHPFHVPVFATSGEWPNVRIVVLRRFWRKNPRALVFHTHAGAPKITEIENDPRVSFLFYHPDERFQVRVTGTASVLTSGDLYEEQWLATEFFPRRCYIGEAPSRISEKPTSGLPANLIDRAPEAEESEIGKANFAVVFTLIHSLDCMELDVRGHRRSHFTWNEAGDLEAKWLTP